MRHGQPENDDNTRLSVRAAIFFVVCAAPLDAQKSSGPQRGTLIVDGGGATNDVRKKFVELAGGANARIVVIPTGPSTIRFGEQNTILDPDALRDAAEWRAYTAYIKEWLGIDTVVFMHTRDRAIASSEAFVRPLKDATGVYLTPGNSGRYAAA